MPQFRLEPDEYSERIRERSIDLFLADCAIIACDLARFPAIPLREDQPARLTRARLADLGWPAELRPSFGDESAKVNE